MKADRKKIQQVMARRHMTVGGVAKAAGLPPQTAAAIICGMNVQPDTLTKIAQALDVGLENIAQGMVLVPARRAGGGRVRRRSCPPGRCGWTWCASLKLWPARG